MGFEPHPLIQLFWKSLINGIEQLLHCNLVKLVSGHAILIIGETIIPFNTVTNDI